MLAHPTASPARAGAGGGASRAAPPPPHRAAQPASPRPAPPARVPTAGQDPASTRARVLQRTPPAPPSPCPVSRCLQTLPDLQPLLLLLLLLPRTRRLHPRGASGVPAAKHPGAAGSAQAEIPRPGRNTPCSRTTRATPGAAGPGRLRTTSAEPSFCGGRHRPGTPPPPAKRLSWGSSIDPGVRSQTRPAAPSLGLTQFPPRV